MLEIIALIFLTRQIADIAQDKGLPRGRWKLYTVLAWFFAEFLGFFLAIMFFGNENLIGIFLTGIMAAIGSYLLIKTYLQKLPDAHDDDIANIGNSTGAN